MHHKAFTLLELIIVIIILGVLASLALPRMFAMTEKAKANEAIKSLSMINKAMVACTEYYRGQPSNPSILVCAAPLVTSNFESLGINNPETEISSHFDYSLPVLATSNVDDSFRWNIRATSKDDPGDYLSLMYSRGSAGGGTYCGRVESVAANESKIIGCGAYESIRIGGS